MKEDVLGYQVDAVGVAACVSDIVRHVRTGSRPSWVACLNPHSYATSRRDADFARALHRAQWLVPDGVGVVLASRVLGGRIRERVTGWDIFTGVNEALAAGGGATVFLLGSTPDTLATMHARLCAEHPLLRVVGTLSPPFKGAFCEEDNKAMRAAINECRPDLLWIGMTAPKQEKWIAANIAYLDVRFIGAIGAVFDFYAGKVQRSSPVYQKLGLEWLPRLLKEPRRLWRRMFVSAPIFIADVLRQRWAQR